ncbi:MAG: hypothetical protein N2Z58_09270 [Fervidobacterium sp.]|nr:hypothetical protein [Fervidobacterium sp.]
MKNNFKEGFATAIVLIFLVISSIILLTIYEIAQNYRNNAVKMSVSVQLDTDALNVLNSGIGYLRSRSIGILGFNVSFSSDTPNWFDNDYMNKLNESWKTFVMQNVKRNSVYKILSFTSSSNFSVDQTLANEIQRYKQSRELSSVELYAFEISKLNLFLVSKVQKGDRVTYAYGIVGSKLLNQYIYFTNKEKLPTGSTIFFKSGELIDGPLRTHDYININNAGGRPTFLSTIEVLGIKDQNGNIVPVSNYQTFADLRGNPPYKILTQQDVDALRFDLIKQEYKAAISGLVNTYDYAKNNPNNLTGLRFTGDITVSFNHGQGGSNYDVKISQGNVDYIITWEPSGPPRARLRRQGGGQPEEFVFNFNGIIYSTGNMTVDGPTKLSTYKGNYTLYSENDILIADRLIPAQTYSTLFTANEHGNNGEEISVNKINQIKNFFSFGETSSLNLVGEKNVRIIEKLNNMKLFGSIFAFDGSFTVDNYNTGSSNQQLFVFGSIMQNLRGPVGTFNPSTGQTLTGYYKSYVYDPRIVTGAYQPAGTPTKSGTIRLFVLGLAK